VKLHRNKQGGWRIRQGHTAVKTAHSEVKASSVLSFTPLWHDKKADQGIRKKRLFKARKLRNSIGETESGLSGRLISIFSTRANGRNILHKQGFNIRWRDNPPEGLETNVYGVREVYFVGMLSLPLVNDYGLCDHFAEVVHGEFCKDFLENELHLFCVQMQ